MLDLNQMPVEYPVDISAERAGGIGAFVKAEQCVRAKALHCGEHRTQRDLIERLSNMCAPLTSTRDLNQPCAAELSEDAPHDDRIHADAARERFDCLVFLRTIDCNVDEHVDGDGKAA